MPASGSDSDKVLSAARIAFGLALLFDGVLKWQLISGGQMQSVISGFGVAAFTANWYAIGVVVALVETVGGFALVLIGLTLVTQVGRRTRSAARPGGGSEAPLPPRDPRGEKREGG